VSRAAARLGANIRLSFARFGVEKIVRPTALRIVYFRSKGGYRKVAPTAV